MTHGSAGTGQWQRPPRIITVVGVALLMVCATFAVRTGWPLRYADEVQYLEIAQGLANGRGFQIEGSATAYRPPAWPLFIAPMAVLGEPSRWVILLSVALLGLSAVFAGRIAAKITGSPWGWLAAPLLLVYPLNLYTASTLYPQLLATAALLAMWAVVLEATQDAESGPTLTAGQGLLIGLLAAVLSLAVPTMIFSGLVVGAWVVWSQRAGRLRTAASMGVGLALPILAWTLRNLVVLGAPVPFSTSSGQNLLIGNNPSATPDSGLAVDISAWIRKAAGLSEPERDALYRQAALDWIIGHPWEAFILWLGKTANYFNPYNSPSTEGQGSTAAMLVGWMSFVLLIAAVVARFALRRSVPLWRSEVLYVVLFILNAPVMAVFFTRTRFRQPLDASLVVIAAIPVALGIAALLDRRRQGLGNTVRVRRESD